MKRIKLIMMSMIATIGLLTAFSVPMLMPATVNAAPKDELCAGIGGCNRTDQGPSLTTTISNVTRILLFIIGAVSVIMIIIGGVRYVVSGGDSSSVNGAKNTILYAVVGLVVAMSAYAIIAFVIKGF